MIWFVCVALLSLSMIACSEKKEAVAPQSVPLQVFKQEISSPAPPKALKVNETATIQVTVKNIGNEPWPITAIDEKGTNLVALGYVWLDSAGKIIKESQGRVLLPNVLMPESSVNLVAKVHTPPKPGDYTLRFSMVQEQVAWFNDKGAEPFIIKVKVKP
jgi:hypothetical protein